MGRSWWFAFFERWPATLPPAPNGRLVPLRRPLDGPLHTVAQRMQQTADMRGIIGHPTGAPDHFTDPLPRPYLAPKAIRLGSTIEQGGQLSTLFARELRRAARGGMRPQPFLYPGPAGPRQPRAGRSPRGSQGGGGLRFFPALLFQLPSSSPPCFAP